MRFRINIHSSMQKLLFALAVCSLLLGCSRHYHPLELSKKQKLVSELIATSSECRAYRDKLAVPLDDDNDVDKIFHEALRAHCVKKDV
jgi:hypothetical protein